jgi:hypothetical protein
MHGAAHSELREGKGVRRLDAGWLHGGACQVGLEIETGTLGSYRDFGLSYKALSMLPFWDGLCSDLLHRVAEFVTSGCVPCLVFR